MTVHKNICDYVYGDVRDRVFILYGLRRTGKTTLIRQVIAEMNEEDFSKTAFIQVSAGIGLQKRRRLFEISSLKSRSVWFENGTEKARKRRNENSKRLIKSAILGNADIFVVRKSYNRQKAQDIAYLVLFCYYIAPLQIGNYTPYEVMLLAKQKRERETRQFEYNITLAWHMEAFAMQKK